MPILTRRVNYSFNEIYAFQLIFHFFKIHPLKKILLYGITLLTGLVNLNAQTTDIHDAYKQAYSVISNMLIGKGKRHLPVFYKHRRKLLLIYVVSQQ